MLLPPSLDRRRSALTDADRVAIRSSTESQRTLAARYGVSRRLIQFIRHPETLVANQEAREARGGWRLYYDKDKHAQAVAATRAHRKAHAAELRQPALGTPMLDEPDAGPASLILERPTPVEGK